ncbi:MAG: DUF3307 domain-containing protein [Betaproteobacteria bacterium HGW-Betaproteobacteria-22]|nr:MAG: DUF3307 domain-containing protein [Betaproteobacteria bacterium HGW-Betaproteobacteria-22]
MFELLLGLFIKHFIVDFPLQACPWIYRNKYIYGHIGGLFHAGLHGSGTYLILYFWLGTDAWALALLDLIAHYHIDWAKMNIAIKFKLNANNSEWFWILLGFDQLLHHLTYFAIAHLAFN